MGEGHEVKKLCKVMGFDRAADVNLDISDPQRWFRRSLAWFSLLFYHLFEVDAGEARAKRCCDNVGKPQQQLG
jgi:hypothetical protein